MEQIIFILLLALSGIAGFFMHRSDFCIAGMFRDYFLFKNRARVRPLVLVIILNMALFHAAYAAGFVGDLPFPWYTKPSWSILLGGIIFGVGMVLAGGCVIGTLYRAGAGQVLSLTAFFGILIGSILFVMSASAVNPLTARLRIGLPVTISDLTGISPFIIVTPVIIAGGLLLVSWYRNGYFTVSSPARGYISPYAAALVIVLVSCASYILVNAPVGVTTSYTKLAVAVVKVCIPDVISRYPILEKTVINYHNPITGSNITGTLSPRWDGIYFVQLPAIIGIVLGSMVSALSLGEFKPRFRVPLRHYASALVGGVLLGYSSRIASGCNIWHLMGGLPILAFGAFLFLAGIVPGAWIGSLILKKYVVR